MEAIKSQARIHPLMAAAAVSVIIVSLAGTAAITGLLPTSKGAPEAQQPVSAVPAGYASPAAPEAGAPAAAYGAAPAMYATAAPAAYAAPAQAVVAQYPVQAAPVAVPATYVQSAPVAGKPAPAVRKPVQHKPIRHVAQTARRDEPSYEQRPAPVQQQQPNYLAIGTGAVVGGLLGNQVGSGNGRKLATVAGIIGGGMLGNEIANRNH